MIKLFYVAGFRKETHSEAHLTILKFYEKNRCLADSKFESWRAGPNGLSGLLQQVVIITYRFKRNENF
jgi:hypothetical protein